jgi:predicted aspartyl protease
MSEPGTKGDTMGKVVVAAKIENLLDLYEVSKGTFKPEQVRLVEVTDALADTGATHLSLPQRYVQQLGLQHYRIRRARTASGIGDFEMYGMVRLTVQGRDCNLEVAPVPDHCPVLIGQVPLEMLDFVVDPIGQRLLGNPEHGGEHMMDLF